MAKFQVSSEYHVPYIAGYNRDGSVIYIDPRVPREYWAFVVIHELTEQHLEDTLGLPYADSHHIATAAERAAVEKDNINWKKYSSTFAALAKECRESFSRLPPDLDMDPYLQAESSQTLIQKMYKLQPSLKSE